MNLKKQLKSYQCRTCFQATKNLKLLTKLVTEETEEPPKSYAELLKEITMINIMEDKSQELPKFICGCCSRKLKSAHDFIQQAQKANEKLLSMLSHEDDRKMMDCLQESQVDIPIFVEIKMEQEDIDGAACSRQETTKCDVKLKLEERDELLLSDKQDMDVLNPNNEDKIIEKINLKENCDKYSSNQLLNMDITKQNESDCEDNIEDDNENNFSEGYEYQEEEESDSYNNHKTKKNVTSKSHKPKANTKGDKNIAVSCNQCDKIFNNSNALSRHQRNIHITEEQKCSCPVCGQKFTQSCNMYKHMRTLHGPESVAEIIKTSTKERIHQCDKCPRKYTKKSHLNYHINAKHSDENEEGKDKSTETLLDSSKTKERSLCSICGASFSSKTHLTVHMRRHTGEKPFKCDLCDRAFPRISELTCHRRIHTGEKPFVCKLCGKAFRVCGKLANHMRSHTDIRPYKCTQCERSFKYSKDLNIHSRIHTGERPYTCTVCGSTFTQSNSLKAHRTKLGHLD